MRRLPIAQVSRPRKRAQPLEVPMPVRPMRAADRRQVIAMMRALWPDERGFLNPHETRREKVLVWVGPDGRLGGFISFSVRPFANGCDTMPVPFVEGWYV